MTKLLKHLMWVLLTALLLAACVRVSDQPANTAPLATASAETYQHLATWGGPGTADGQFSLPFGVAVDANSNVYVADTGNHRIQKFSSNGALVTKWGSFGSGNGQFNLPSGVAVDAAGNVYVADRSNHRIQKFTSNGVFLVKWGSEGTGNGQFNAPHGVTVNASGNVYVADYNNHRIQTFTANGAFLGRWGSQGPGNGQFYSPHGVAVDASGNVYVTDYGSHRVQKFTSIGGFLGKWGSYGTGDGQFNLAIGVAVDASGNVYVVDHYNRRIQKFGSDGTFVTKWGSSGSGDGQFNIPTGVAVDASGRVYVADYGNHRIQTFGLVVSDTTPPTITPTVVGTLGDNGWYTSDVDVSWTVTDDESAISSSTGCSPTTINADTAGVTLTCEATSAGGTSSESVTIKRDATPPTLNPSVSPSPVLLNGSGVASAGAADALSGIASAGCDLVDTSSVGTKSVSCSASDNAGNTDSMTHRYTITYGFAGFSSPVDNGGILNVAKAGQTIPLKWRLTDAPGNPVTTLASARVTVTALSCSLGSGSDEVEEYASGSSGLQNLGDGYYQFNWKTPKNYANTCKTMHLDLGEGTTRTALFKFTR